MFCSFILLFGCLYEYVYVVKVNLMMIAIMVDLFQSYLHSWFLEKYVATLMLSVDDI